MNIMSSQLEKNIYALSLDEQLWLMERLVQHIRKGASVSVEEDIDAQFTAMANDPEIQNELRLIEEEFAIVETDGLDVV